MSPTWGCVRASLGSEVVSSLGVGHHTQTQERRRALLSGVSGARVWEGGLS